MGPGSRSLRSLVRDDVDGFNFQTTTPPQPRGAKHPSCSEVACLSDKQRAQGMPGARCAAAARVVVVSTRVSPRSHRNHPAFPAQRFTAYSALSPVIGLCCHRRRPRCESIVASLMPASRHQDHTASPSAFRAVRQERIRVHRIPRPTFCDDRETPLLWGTGRREVLKMICPTAQAKFSNRCGHLARRANQLRRRNSCQVNSNCLHPPSFRGARRASPESILPVVVMDSPMCNCTS
jgi:hypothetical protein